MGEEEATINYVGFYRVSEGFLGVLGASLKIFFRHDVESHINILLIRLGYTIFIYFHTYMLHENTSAKNVL